MKELRGPHLASIALAMAFLLLPVAAQGQPTEAPPENPGELQQIAIAPFAVLSDQGALVTRREAAHADLARLTRVIPSAIAARLVQAAEYEVLELDEGYRPFEEEPPIEVAAVPEPVARWLRADLADEIITGSVGMLQSSLVVTAQRYGWRDGQPALLGAAVATSARLDDAIKLADAILEDLFPIEADIVSRSIEQLFIVPSTMRLPIGRQSRLQALAIDALGRPLSKVNFIYQSSDSSYLEVDQDGVVTGIAPGQATVTVRAVGRPARTSIATATVNVVPPSFGLRVGTVIGGRDVEFGRSHRVGLRITPTVDLRPRTTPQAQVTKELEFEPNETMLFTIDAIQRTGGGSLERGSASPHPCARAAPRASPCGSPRGPK